MYWHESFYEMKSRLSQMDSYEAKSDLIQDIEEYLDDLYFQVHNYYLCGQIDQVDMEKAQDVFEDITKRMNYLEGIIFKEN